MRYRPSSVGSGEEIMMRYCNSSICLHDFGECAGVKYN
jgi:hypothetical protein